MMPVSSSILSSSLEHRLCKELGYAVWATVEKKTHPTAKQEMNQNSSDADPDSLQFTGASL